MYIFCQKMAQLFRICETNVPSKTNSRKQEAQYETKFYVQNATNITYLCKQFFIRILVFKFVFSFRICLHGFSVSAVKLY
jgi:hypothetical protein